MHYTSFIKKTAKISLFIFFMLGLSGWSLFKTESSLVNDKENFNKVLNGFFVTYWKGAKLSIRALPIKKQMSIVEFEQAKKEHNNNMPFGEQLSKAYNWESILNGIDEGRKKLSVKQFTSLAKEIYSLPSTIKNNDEDDYPTFFEIIANTRALFQKEPVILPENWNASMEHWLFAIGMESQLGFKSWKTYELHRVKADELHTTDLQTLAFIHKGIDHLRHDRYYLAEEEFTQSLAILEKKDISLLPHSERFFNAFSTKSKIEDNKEPNTKSNIKANTKTNTEERFRHYVSGLNYLLRGFSRKKMETETANQLAQQDIAQTISDFSKAGIDNEFTWLAQSYLHLGKKESEAALDALVKLENSELLSKKDKTLIANTKQKLAENDSEQALKLLSESNIMYKLGMNYATSYLSEVAWTKLLETTEEGKRVFSHFIGLQETFEKAKRYLRFLS